MPSLVGSEMCIRDSTCPQMVNSPAAGGGPQGSSFQLTSYSPIFLLGHSSRRPLCTKCGMHPQIPSTRIRSYQAALPFTNVPCTTPGTRATPDHCTCSTDCTYLTYIFVGTVLSSMYSTPRRVCGPRRTLLYIPVHAGHAGSYCTYKIHTRYVHVLFPYLSSHLQWFTRVSRIPISDVSDPIPD